MRKSRFTEEQVIQAIKRVDAGLAVTAICRELGISEHTFYRWKKKYGGMDVTDAPRLRQLEDENARLKRIVADKELDIEALKVALGKNA